METQKYISLGKHVIRFGGQSKFSNSSAQDVEVHVVVDYVNDIENDYESASVMAGFSDDQWDTYSQGDIYSDPIFKEQIRAIVTEAGYSNSFGYSELGMQHEFYAHFDLAVNDKLREDEGNFEFPWERVHELSETKQLMAELANMDKKRQVMHKRLCELKKKYNIK